MGVSEEPETGLLDRQEALRQLAAACASARQGQGTVVVVEGSAGAGKSSVLSAAARAAAAEGLQVLRSRGGELERDYAFGVIRQLFEPPISAASDKRRGQLLSGAAAPAAVVLGLGEPGAPGPADGFAGLHAIYWLTVNLSQQGPLLLVVDDAHWSDVSSLRALDYLARRIADLPLVVLVAMRQREPGAPDELLDSLRTVPDAVSLVVFPLDQAAVAELVRRRIPQADAELCDAISQATGGNPLLVQELVRALGSGNGRPRAEDVASAALPSLGERLLRRVERVDPDAAQLARAMAVLGDGGRLSTAAELVGVDRLHAGRIAHELRRIEVLSAEDPFVFVHPLNRRSLYDGIPESERHSIHRAAAEALEREGAAPERVASHLRVLPAEGSSRVAATLLAAARRALGRAAPDETIAWLDRAIAEQAPEPSEAELMAHLATAQTLTRGPAVVATLQRAYEVVEDPARRGEIAASLSYILASAGEWERAIEVIERADLELSADDAEVHAELTAMRAAVERYDPQRIADFERNRAEYESVAAGHAWGSRAMASVLAVDASFRGRPEEARALSARAQVDDLLLGSHAASWAAPQLFVALLSTDELDAAADAIETAKVTSDATGATLGTVFALGYAAGLSVRRGDLVAAEADLQRVIRLSELASVPMVLVTLASMLVEVLLERGAEPQFAAQIEQAQLLPQLAGTYTGALLLETRGRLRLAGKRRNEGIADLRSAGEILRKLEVGPSGTVWRSELALALPASRRGEAAVLVDDELGLARESGLPRSVGVALRAKGLLAVDPDESLELLEASLERLEHAPSRLELARSLTALGSVLRRCDRASDARAPLERSLELAIACGAQNLSRRTSAELLAAGGRRADLRGAVALTAAESRVAELAAAGASNAAIAQSLFVSLKTVETHLAHTYAKLGLAGAGSRRRLAKLLKDTENHWATPRS